MKIGVLARSIDVTSAVANVRALAAAGGGERSGDRSVAAPQNPGDSAGLVLVPSVDGQIRRQEVTLVSVAGRGSSHRVPACPRRCARISTTYRPRCSTSCSTAPCESRLPPARSHTGRSQRTSYLELVITGVIRLRDRARRPDDDHPVLPVGRALGAMSLLGRVRRTGDQTGARGHPAADDLSSEGPHSRSNPALRARLVELSERARAFVNEIPGTAFATVRQRVRANSRPCVDLSERQRSERRARGSDHPARSGRAVGTVREVVVRALRQLRDAGAVRTERDRIVLLDAAHLTEEVKWNTSR